MCCAPFKFAYGVNPIIICGPVGINISDEAIINLSETIKAPILADSLSQLRFNIKHPHIFSYYDMFLNVIS